MRRSLSLLLLLLLRPFVSAAIVPEDDEEVAWSGEVASWKERLQSLLGGDLNDGNRRQIWTLVLEFLPTALAIRESLLGHEAGKRQRLWRKFSEGVRLPNSFAGAKIKANSVWLLADLCEEDLKLYFESYAAQRVLSYMFSEHADVALIPEASSLGGPPDADRLSRLGALHRATSNWLCARQGLFAFSDWHSDSAKVGRVGIHLVPRSLLQQRLNEARGAFEAYVQVRQQTFQPDLVVDAESMYECLRAVQMTVAQLANLNTLMAQLFKSLPVANAGETDELFHSASEFAAIVANDLICFGGAEMAFEGLKAYAQIFRNDARFKMPSTTLLGTVGEPGAELLALPNRLHQEAPLCRKALLLELCQPTPTRHFAYELLSIWLELSHLAEARARETILDKVRATVRDQGDHEAARKKHREQAQDRGARCILKRKKILDKCFNSIAQIPDTGMCRRLFVQYAEHGFVLSLLGRAAVEYCPKERGGVRRLVGKLRGSPHEGDAGSVPEPVPTIRDANTISKTKRANQ